MLTSGLCFGGLPKGIKVKLCPALQALLPAGLQVHMSVYVFLDVPMCVLGLFVCRCMSACMYIHTYVRM